MVNQLSTKTLFITSLLINFSFCTILVPVSARIQGLHHLMNNNGSLSFLVIGDWGPKGWYNQSQDDVHVSVYLHLGRL
ncbi:hypothetical protein R6Q59_003262 [Mikania micrantha]